MGRRGRGSREREEGGERRRKRRERREGEVREGREERERGGRRGGRREEGGGWRVEGWEGRGEDRGGREGSKRSNMATLCAKIRTMGAVETVLCNRMRDGRQTRIKIERQLASVQESHCQDREDFKKLKDFMTSQSGYRS
ncbi:hypothetical protein Tco_1143815 [Tanacetum coccineum]